MSYWERRIKGGKIGVIKARVVIKGAPYGTVNKCYQGGFSDGVDLGEITMLALIGKRRGLTEREQNRLEVDLSNITLWFKEFPSRNKCVAKYYGLKIANLLDRATYLAKTKQYAALYELLTLKIYRMTQPTMTLVGYIEEGNHNEKGEVK